ncbi:MAG TPA: serine/threonine-protein kinase [Chondromyces sp.]|nr:serine/threonine-protein kinase [Chondromyces sp.]
MSVERVGRYLIEETLGRGAMGVVYLARDPLIDRRVALKTLRLDLDAEHAEEFRERFVREARAAGRLNHPGIVTIHDVGEDPESGLMYIAMEYVEGRDLKQLLAAGHHFRPSEAARIAADVANALDYAHSLGVVHRDIKPANIMLTGNGTAKITDFGIARLETSNLTVDGQFIGTPNFMSPEQVTGREVDGRSDLFSLGVVLFNLLTDQRPWGGGTMHEVTLRIVQEPCPIPSTVDGKIPPAFNPVVLKCLEKNPERRFQSGAELARVLAALARSLTARQADDDGGTAVVQPDLETRIAAPSGAVPAASAGPKLSRLWSDVRARLAGFELPEWLDWEVRPRWAWSLLGAMLLVLVVVVFGLRSRIDRGPFAAPSAASIRNLNSVAGSLQEAQRRLTAGELAAAERSVMAALDQAPTSPAARRLAREIRDAIEIERTGAANQRRVAELVDEGRALYRGRDYPAARARFAAALELDPQHELAASYLELAEERLAGDRARRAGATAPAAATTASATTAPPPQPESGIARITVVFDSPLSSGTVALALNGESLAEVPFDFTTSGFLGLRKKGRGTVRRVVLTPSGEHRIGIELRHPKRGVMGSASFIRKLAPDSDWTLRVDLPSEQAEPSFFLVARAQ